MDNVKRTKASIKLRCRAEQQLKLNSTEADDSRLDDEPMRLLHELQVHQVELEMQNSELLQTRDRLETALDKYTDLYDFAPVCYITLNHASEISAINLAGASLIGGIRSRLIGRKFGTFVAAADRSAFAVFLDTVLTSRIKESCEVVLLNTRKQPIIVQIEAMATVSGQEFRLALIDITGRKSLEAHLMQAEKMETVVLLAGGIARDIDNILHVIVGYGACSEMNMKADDPLRVNLEQIIAAADRGANLTKSLLNFSRMQPVNPLPLDINGLVRNVETFVSMVVGEDILLEIACSEQRLEVTADRSQLEQVIISLATNARHAMPGGGRLSILMEAVKIDTGFIRLHGFGEPGNFAKVSVTDNGTGMNRETSRKIFEPFFTSDNGTGTGLGLSIVYSIIRQHNGHIDVSSEPGKGTTFKIYLPLTDTSHDQDEKIPEKVRSKRRTPCHSQ